MQFTLNFFIRYKTQNDLYIIRLYQGMVVYPDKVEPDLDTDPTYNKKNRSESNRKEKNPDPQP